MVRYLGDEPAPPTKLDHIVLRILDDIRRATREGDDVHVLNLVEEIVDLAMTYASVEDKKALMRLKKAEDYVINEILKRKAQMDVEMSDLYGASKPLNIIPLMQEVRMIFAREKKKLALGALSRQGFIHQMGALYKLEDGLEQLVYDINAACLMRGIRLDLTKKVLKEVMGGG